MYLRAVLGFALSLGEVVVQVSAQSGTSSPTATASAPQSTACGDIIDIADTGVNIFLASDVFECLISVPFNPAVATRFIQYYNDTLQFQSTLAYLKSPPPSYQQPAVDLIAGLNEIQSAIDTGFFQNQYDFEKSLQTLLYSAHDSHLQLYAGLLSAFTFGSPYELVSVSLDGELPKVYLLVDALAAINDQTNGVPPSAISTINGQDVEDYLVEYAANNTFASVDPNADWNQLMYSPALAIQGYFSIFGGATTLYPGDELSFVFEDGTNSTVPWLAIYNNPGPTGPLTTGGDFYNFFVLGFYPASFNASALNATSTVPSNSSATSTSTPTPTGWDFDSYPAEADVVQPDLSTFGGGFLTGYFLNDTLTGVLSIPSFEADDDNITAEYSSTVGEFLQRSRQAGIEKIVIDVQQNSGGNVLLAFDTYKQFFPDNEPYGGSRLRAQPTTDVLGNTITNIYDTVDINTRDYDVLSVDEFAATARLNAATGQNFSSWAEFFGPHPEQGDLFTTTQRYNLSSSIFDLYASTGIEVYGYGNRSTTAPEPYSAENIIILSDGLCASACAVFMEMMHHEAGVRTVAVGGQPSFGPMQAPSGSRGALYYTADDIDDNIAYVIASNDTTTPLLPDRDNNDVYITSLGVNLRDQVRQGETIPLQFVYEAADCRIFFTPQTIYNYTNLWQYAADAIWSDASLCVANSTGYATYNTTDTKGPFPTSPSQNQKSNADISRYLDLSSSSTQSLAEDLSSGLPDFFIPIAPRTIGTQTAKFRYSPKIQDKFRVRKGNFKGPCTSGSPRCGGTKTGPTNPKNTLPPKTQPSPDPAPSPEAAPSPEGAPTPTPVTGPENVAKAIQAGFRVG